MRKWKREIEKEVFLPCPSTKGILASSSLDNTGAGFVQNQRQGALDLEENKNKRKKGKTSFFSRRKIIKSILSLDQCHVSSGGTCGGSCRRGLG